MKFVYKVLTLFTLCALYLPLAHTQVTLKITNLPANTPSNAKIYFAGSIQNWNPADPGYELKTDTDGKYFITMPEGTGTVLYKFTRGSWAAVEGGPNREEIGNRSFTFTGQPQTILLTIQTWKDAAPSTAASNVQIVNNSFQIPQLGRTRRIWLYLPPDYNTTTKRYPVLYMQDGQNLFDNSTSFSGEWQVDETLNALHAGGDYGAIVVGIDNGGGERLNEYSPWNNPSYGGGQGDAYADFMALTLKPYIDANFRTLSGPQNNCIFGSSMGGLIALYGALKYPNLFGKVGSFSPAYWFSFSNLNNYISSNTSSIADLRIQHTAGQNESANLVNQITQVRNNLTTKGLQGTNDQVVIDPAGTHSESFWRTRFGEAYQWLFPNTTLPVSMSALKAERNAGCQVLLSWEVFDAQNHQKFEIEQSTDGRSFSKKGELIANSSNRYPMQFQYIIRESNAGKSYFRLRQMDQDGSSRFSAITTAPDCLISGNARILPNPVNDRFRIPAYPFAKGDRLQLSTLDGKMIRHWTATDHQYYNMAGLPAGTYLLGLNGSFFSKILKN